ncbi:MAG TPA: hypothetical protein VL354_21825 [Spirochaetia bacterium]|nr:hypothetical protein [Spirochaetia bacterium]
MLKLGGIFHREGPPDAISYGESIAGALEALQNESPRSRPPDDEGRPGGLVFLDRGLATIVVPDLHARMDFFLAVLGYEARKGCTVIELLDAGGLQVVCLGDGVHAEGRAAQRWKAAQDEFLDEFQDHRNMDEEMRESLGVMEMVMEIKRRYPEHFHFLKGNHENITNESGGGNLPFRKFALEGAMVLEYMRQFYGSLLLSQYARMEKELPLLAVGPGFLLSHAEPATFYPPSRVIRYRSDPEVVLGLTWTDNDEAMPGSVESMLRYYLGEAAASKGFYLGGHRPALGSYKLRAGGKYVQIHDPEQFVIANLPCERPIELERDIVYIDERSILAV